MSRIVLLGAITSAVAAMVGGVVLLVLQVPLDFIRDSTTFDAAVGQLREKSSSLGDFEKASMDFHQLREAHDTGKGLMIDLGSSMIVAGVALLALSVFLPRSRALRSMLLHTHRFRIVVFIAIFATVGVFAGFVVETITMFDRYEVPPWADSLALPFGAAIIGAPIFLAVLVAIIGVPHLRIPVDGKSLWTKPRPDLGGILAMAVYGTLAVGCIYLALSSIAFPAGSIYLLPTLMIGWLMLHARAVASS